MRLSTPREWPNCSKTEYSPLWVSQSVSYQTGTRASLLHSSRSCALSWGSSRTLAPPITPKRTANQRKRISMSRQRSGSTVTTSRTTGPKYCPLYSTPSMHGPLRRQNRPPMSSGWALFRGRTSLTGPAMCRPSKGTETIITARRNAREAMKRAQELLGRKTHHRPYQKGQKVWLEGTNLQTTHPTAKLRPKRYGPFKITEIIGSTTYRLELPPQWR